METVQHENERLEFRKQCLQKLLCIRFQRKLMILVLNLIKLIKRMLSMLTIEPFVLLPILMCLPVREGPESAIHGTDQTGKT